MPALPRDPRAGDAPGPRAADLPGSAEIAGEVPRGGVVGANEEPASAPREQSEEEASTGRRDRRAGEPADRRGRAGRSRRPPGTAPRESRWPPLRCAPTSARGSVAPPASSTPGGEDLAAGRRGRGFFFFLAACRDGRAIEWGGTGRAARAGRKSSASCPAALWLMYVAATGSACRMRHAASPFLFRDGPASW